jgi:hypothetical protein
MGSFLKACKKRIKENGRLIVLTGNPYSISASISTSNWWYIQHPEHNIFPSYHFFSTLGDFQLDKYVPVFNSNYFRERNLWLIDKAFPQKILEMVSKIIKSNYDGLPSVDKDHALVILRKK